MVASLLLLAVPAAAQDPQPPQPAPSKRAEWPTLKGPVQTRVRALVKQFRKDKEELHEQAHDELCKVGAGAAPILMQLVSDRADNVNDQLFAVLDRIVTAEHSALLARETRQPSVELRRYLMQRLCRVVDADLVPVFETAAGDKDEAIAFYAALALLAHKREAGVAGVLQAARLRWSEVAPLVAEVLPAARSAECANWVFAAIAQAPAAEQMAGLRLLRYLMVPQQAVILRTYLQAADHTVKREAINTARVLHGEEPIENLPVFQAIEMAKQWLEKLR